MRYVSLCVVYVCIYGMRFASCTVNYCGAKMCENGSSHTFCKYSEGPGELCTGYSPAQLSGVEKMNILFRMNRRRDEAARGLLQHLPSAADMTALTWVEELAREAQLWADQCIPPNTPEERDECRDLYSMTVGQNVASVIGEAPGLRPESFVDMWYMQNKHYKGNVSSYEPSPKTYNTYEDFAQMLWSRTFMVGCGRSRFVSDWRGRLIRVERLVCNFAPCGPLPFDPLWRPGQPASSCSRHSSPDQDFTGLCSIPIQVGRNISWSYFENMGDINITQITKIHGTSNIGGISNNSEVVKELSKEKEIELEGLHDNINKQEIITNGRKKIRRHVNEIMKQKKKLTTIGRPKRYNTKPRVDDKLKFHETDIYEITTSKQVWNEMAPTEIANVKNVKVEKEMQISNSKVPTIPIATSFAKQLTISKEVETSSTVKAFSLEDIGINTLSVSTDETEGIEDKILEDYISDPIKVMKLKETLERMENYHSNKFLHSPYSVSPTDSMRNPRTKLKQVKARRDVQKDDERFLKFKNELAKSAATSTEGVNDMDTNNYQEIFAKKPLLQQLWSLIPDIKTLGIVSDHDAAACALSSHYLTMSTMVFYLLF